MQHYNMFKKNIRLSKVAKEFNVGISTITEFLHKKGHDINPDPNGKITPECYDILVKEYSSEISAKKESEKLGLRKSKEKNSSISIEDIKEPKEEEPASEPQEEVVLIKDSSSKNSRTTDVATEPEKKQESSKFKILDKLNIFKNGNKSNSEEATLNKPSEEVISNKPSEVNIVSENTTIDKISDETITEIKSTPPTTIFSEAKTDDIAKEKTVVENIVDKKPEVTKSYFQQPEIKISEPKETITQGEILPIVLTETFELKTENPNIANALQKSAPSETVKKVENAEDVKIAEQKPINRGENIVQPSIEENKNMHPKPERNIPFAKKEGINPISKAKKTEDAGENEVKVIGKIDLDSLNQKTRPTKKTRKQKEQERKQKARNQAEIMAKLAKENEAKTPKANIDAKSATTETPKEEAEIYHTPVQKLTGPTVVGKLDLSTIDKKPVASSNEKKKKRKKRKRIQKDGETTTTSGTNTNTNANTNTNSNQKNQHKKPHTPGQRPAGGGGGGGGDQHRNKKPIPQDKDAKKITRRPPVKKVIDDDDVQKQIKETLARLTAGKHKSKGSKFRKLKRDEQRSRLREEERKAEAKKNILNITEFLTVNELACFMEVPVNEVISVCMSIGQIVSINQRLDAETITIVADEFGFEVVFVTPDEHGIAIEEIKDTEESLLSRAPIVTVMGHVDHGKTSLLDYIRNTNVIAGEAGGITQHIGAYNVTLDNGKKITFLDTPGHQAFTAMRARGAKITDIAIIVVSADDSVMPQTVEAINHASAANVPIIFAINKIDKHNANPEKIKKELAEMKYLVEDWGGKYQSQDISAKFGKNVEELLEKVLLEAEMLDLKANPNRLAKGSVIESSLDKGRGYVATVLVDTGTLKVGDFMLAGSHTGKIKAMYNERNQRIEEAGPSEPALILGLHGAPQAGDSFHVMENEKEAKDIAAKKSQLQREVDIRTQKHITLDEIGRRIAIGNFKELNVIVKGDVDGSIEALADSLLKLSTEQIQVNVIHKAVGQISESDVMLAAASNALIIGFQVRPSMSARKLAEREEIDIRLYSIIYDAINELKDAMEGMLSPKIKEEITGSLEILETFKITKVGTIAGCLVREGRINRTNKVRIIRDGIVVYSGELGSLKRFKDDAKEVRSGLECGLNIEKFNDIKVGDIVECFIEKEVKQTL